MPATDDMFQRCNISEELLTRLTRGRTGTMPQPASSKRELEKLLLNVKLDHDTSDVPLYSNDYQTSLCLPSSGKFFSSSKNSLGVRNHIRTCYSADERSPDNSPERTPSSARLKPARDKGAASTNVRRTQSLKQSSVTDRIQSIRDRHSEKKRESKLQAAGASIQGAQKNIANIATQISSTTRNSTATKDSIATKEPLSKKDSDSKKEFIQKSKNANAENVKKLEQASSIIQRARSFNRTDNQRSAFQTRSRSNLQASDLPNKPVESNVVKRTRSFTDKVKPQVENRRVLQSSSVSSIRQRFTDAATTKTDTNEIGAARKQLKSSSFGSIQGAWEKRGENPAEKQEEPAELDVAARRRERRKARQSSRASLGSDRSDSENENETHLTQAALDRLERRSRNAIRNRDRFYKNKVSQDDNNNEINSNNSDKTHDSGIFDLALNNLSQDIRNLSKRYDSDDLLLDDGVGLNSGYSSATESLAESISTYYDSDNETMDGRKKRNAAGRFNPFKFDKNPLKSASSSALKQQDKTSSLASRFAGNKSNSSSHLLTQQESKSKTAVARDNASARANNRTNSSCENKSASSTSGNHSGISAVENSEPLREDCNRKPNNGAPTRGDNKVSAAEQKAQLSKNDSHSDKRKNTNDNNKRKQDINPSNNRVSDELASATRKSLAKSNNIHQDKITSRSDTNNIDLSNEFSSKKSNYKTTDKNEKPTPQQQQQKFAYLRRKPTSPPGGQRQRPASEYFESSHHRSHANNHMDIMSSRKLPKDDIQIKLAKSVLLPSLKDTSVTSDSPRNGKQTGSKHEKSDIKGNANKTTDLNENTISSSRDSSMERKSVLKTFAIDNRGKEIRTRGVITRGDSLDIKIDIGTTDLSILSNSKLADSSDEKQISSSTNDLTKVGKGVSNKKQYTKSISSNNIVSLNRIEKNIPLKNDEKQDTEKEDNKQKKVEEEQKKENNKAKADRKVTPSKTATKKLSSEEKTFYYAPSSGSHKSVQCLLLTDDSPKKTSTSSGVQIADTTGYISQDIVDAVGQDLLVNVDFKYPEYLLPKNGEDGADSDMDTTDFPDEQNFEIVKQMNLRLQKLLLEVEKARASSVKALLHVNNAYNELQTQNTRLEGDLRVSTQENDFLTQTVKTLKDQIAEYAKKEEVQTSGDNVDRSLSIIVDSWKREKKTLNEKLDSYKTRSEGAENDVTRFRVQFEKVREQLDTSNATFNRTLENNLTACRKMEEQMQSYQTEKKELVTRCKIGDETAKELGRVRLELSEQKLANDELEDEKDELETKVKRLEKQKKQLLFEQEELHDQIGLSQEIIENLTEAEQDLTDRLVRETQDKEYLQECLDETGNILYQLKNHQEKLISDKEILLDDLENEVSAKENLEVSLQVQNEEQKDLMEKLQDMTKVHITVQESLQLATKKEKNYQEEIEGLTKTNLILHYTLEKEKEERGDLQEMCEVAEMEHKKFKMESVGKTRDLEKRVDELLVESHQLTQMKDELALKCDQQASNLETLEDEHSVLSEKHSKLEQMKSSVDAELASLRDSGSELAKNVSEISQAHHESQTELKVVTEKCKKLEHSLQVSESNFEQTTRELLDTKSRLGETKHDADELSAQLKERCRLIRELESQVEHLSEQRDKYTNRISFYESETKELRKQVHEQTDEIGSLKIDTQRVCRERDTNKRNLDMSVRDFEKHKITCTESLRALREEIAELHKKITEKDRIMLKQKQQFETDLESTQRDLKFLRQLLNGADMRRQSLERLKRDTVIDDQHKKVDLKVLKSSHDRFRDEFALHVEKLEDMLKDSHLSNEPITVVKSPMSRIKLDELKQLRADIQDVHADLTKLKRKVSKMAGDAVLRDQDDSDMDALLAALSKIETRHTALMTQSAALLQKTLDDDDEPARDLVKKFQVASLKNENRQLKTLLGILKNTYDFDEHELVSQLDKLQTEDEELFQYSSDVEGNNNNNKLNNSRVSAIFNNSSNASLNLDDEQRSTRLNKRHSMSHV